VSFERSIVDSIRKAICNEAERRGQRVKVEKRHGSQFTRTGEPDLFGCLDGKHFEIEVKRPGQRPEDIQFVRLKEWAAAGAISGWATNKREALAILWPPEIEPETSAQCTAAKPLKRPAKNNPKVKSSAR
jgi:hypothetical protein